MADEYGGVRRASLLGKQGRVVLRRQRRRGPDGRERVPGRTLSGPEELGGAGVSQTDPLQQGGEGRPLRGLGTATALFGRGSCGLPRTPLVENEKQHTRRSHEFRNARYTKG